MELFNRHEIYRRADALIKSVQSGVQSELAVFGITPAIYQEITEELESSAESVADLRLPAYDIAFIADSIDRVPVEIEKTESDSDLWRVYIQLWGRNSATDLTLIADYSFTAGSHTFIFRLLETQ